MKDKTTLVDEDRAHTLEGGYRLVRGRRFWECALEDEDRVVVVREGVVGTAGSITRRRFRNAPDARGGAGQLRTVIERKGFRRVVWPPLVAPSRENRALLQAIVDDPESASGFLVYSDWLQTQGDPRGELIALQHAGKKRAAATYLARHAPSLLGPLQRWLDQQSTARRMTIAWRLGFIDSARLSGTTPDGDDELVPGVAEAAQALLEHPSGRVVRALSVDGVEEMGPIIDLIARRGGTLRVLKLGDAETFITAIGDLGRLWKALPRLEELVVEGEDIALGKIVAPQLRRLVLRTGGLKRAAARSLAGALLPSLETLEVGYGNALNCDARWDDVRAVLDGDHLPRLRELAIHHTPFDTDAVQLLVKSPLGARLRRLTYSGALDDTHAALLAQPRLAHLELLDVRQNWLTPIGIRALRRVFKRVLVTPQREEFFNEDDDYFDDIAE